MVSIKEYLEEVKAISKRVDHILEAVEEDLKVLIGNKEMSEETVSSIQLYSSLYNVEAILNQLQELE